MKKKQLEVYASMGGTYGVGWQRDDAPMIHLFANVAPGQRFQPVNSDGGPHWPCDVCRAHGFTEADFHAQIQEALKRGPAQ